MYQMSTNFFQISYKINRTNVRKSIYIFCVLWYIIFSAEGMSQVEMLTFLFGDARESKKHALQVSRDATFMLFVIVNSM